MLKTVLNLVWDVKSSFEQLILQDENFQIGEMEQQCTTKFQTVTEIILVLWIPQS